MKKGVKGQAALEFMMTYGWALMVFLGIIGAMAYMGIFDFDYFINERCEFSSGVYCKDAALYSSDVKVVIQNAMVIDIENVSIMIPECSVNPAAGPTTIISGEQELYNLTCANIIDRKLKSKVYFNYTNPDSGLLHTKVGTLVLKQ